MEYTIKKDDLFYVISGHSEILHHNHYIHQHGTVKAPQLSDVSLELNKDQKTEIKKRQSKPYLFAPSKSDDETTEPEETEILKRMRGEPKDHDLVNWEPHRVPLSVQHTGQFKQNYKKGIKKITRWKVSKKNHLIVAGDFSNLEFILKALRDPHLPVVHIVLLGPKPPEKRFWRFEMDLTKVYYVRGSPTSKFDWTKCAAKDAAYAVIFGGPDRNDSQTILSALACKEAAPELYVTTDLYDESSIQYLEESVGGPFWSSFSFMSGSAFCDSIFERLIVCGHYNEHIMDLLQVIITRETLQRKLQSRLMAIRVPLPFVGKTYIDFFKFSYLYGCVPVALYRRQESFPYSYTNPDPNTVLDAKDLIMILIPNTLNKPKNKDLLESLKKGDILVGENHFDTWKKTVGRFKEHDQEIEKLEELKEEDDTPYYAFDEQNKCIVM